MSFNFSHFTFDVIRNCLSYSLRNSGIQNIGGHYLYTKNINNDFEIIDLGANKGAFFNAYYQLFGGKIHAVEAAPNLFLQLPKIKDIHLYNLAIHNSKGTLRFNISANDEANSINTKISEAWGLVKTIEVASNTLENFIEENKIEKIDILKVDIEGAEIEMFNSTSDRTFSKVSQIAIEFHDFLDQNQLSEVQQIIKRMSQLNFKIIVFSDYDFREVLFLNKKLIQFSFFEKINLNILFPVFKAVKKGRQLLIEVLR